MEKTLLNIDYLIVNLEGQPFGEFPEDSPFRLVYHEYGTKIFQSRADVYYESEKIGTFMHTPRSVILGEDFAQFQFENHLFYTKTLKQNNVILSKFCEETHYSFKSINRLDICIDKSHSGGSYRELYDKIISGRVLISGRPKNIQSYFETFKGRSVLNGFQIGKRSSAKLLRLYNKTLSLQLDEKPYINAFYEANGLENHEVWRFEYQLNSKFFSDLLQGTHGSKFVSERVTWGIFVGETLTELLKMANAGFFDIHENTGLSQINKEKRIDVFDFDALQKSIGNYKPIVTKITKSEISTTTIKKRLAKSLFREYYASGQDVSYIIALNMVLDNQDMKTERKLLEWFAGKVFFYLHEFRNKDKILREFNFAMYHEHQDFILTYKPWSCPEIAI